MRKFPAACLVLAASCGGAKRSPFGTLTDDAKKALLSYCPKVVSEERKEFPVPKGVRVDRPLEIRCTGPDPDAVPDAQMGESQASGDIALDESDRRVVYANLSVKLRDADFDARLNAFVASAIDPWIHVASHDELVKLIREGGNKSLSGEGWSISASSTLTPEAHWKDGRVAQPALRNVDLRVEVTP